MANDVRRRRFAEAKSLTELVECGEELILARQYDSVTCRHLATLAADRTRDETVRGAALCILAVFGEHAQDEYPTAHAILLDKGEHWKLRRIAAWACGRMPEAFPSLAALPGLEPVDARTWEALALWVAGPAAATYAGSLRLKLKQGDRDLAIVAGEALIRLSDANLREVRRVLENRGFLAIPDSGRSGDESGR